MPDPRDAEAPLIEVQRGSDGHYTLAQVPPWWDGMKPREMLLMGIMALGTLAPFIGVAVWLIQWLG